MRLMAPDLLYGFGVMTGLTLTLFLLGVVIGGRVSRKMSLLLLGVGVGAIVLYLIYLWDDVLLANLLPFSNLVVVGNWLPPLTGLIAGIAWKSMPGSLRRRNSYTAVEFLIAFLAMLLPVWGTTPACENEWKGQICLQTSNETCSAACAATLLRLHGIDTSEQEMAELCLTNHNGTSWQGLYRGLTLKTKGTRFQVQVLPCGPHDLPLLTHTNAILSVGIPQGAEVDPIYTEDYGWGIGELHSVVFFGFNQEGYAIIGDPEVGMEPWSWDDLQVLIRGRAVRLIRGGEDIPQTLSASR
ncbi:MAG: hypothetical protein HUJ26_02345 [Planctomycetaceae bacterium]|nr:hypothetical protein [Planctomycetaceae bacterium]